MRRLLAVILGLWLVAYLAIGIAMKPFWVHPCYAPIAIQRGQFGNREQIVDFGTGLVAQRDTILLDEPPTSHWLVINNHSQLSVIDSETGAIHPQLNHAIDGFSPIWTEQSLWFMRQGRDTFSIWRASIQNATIQLEQENARLHAVSPDDRWQFFSRHKNGYEFDIIYYLNDSLTGQSYEFLNVQASIFSDDSRCLIVKRAISQPALTSIVTVYDLTTMQALYTQQGDPMQYNYAWYRDK